MEKRDNKSIIKDEFKGIDSVSDDELEYFGSDPMKKAAVEEIIEQSKISHKSKGIKVPVWFEYAGPAKKISAIATCVFILNIPLSIIGTIILFFLGVLLDRYIFTWKTMTLGHAVPIFTVILPFLGICIFVIIAVLTFLTAVISLIVSKIRKE